MSEGKNTDGMTKLRNFTFGLLIGAAVGAGILYAVENSKEKREKFKTRAAETIEILRANARNAAVKINDAASDAVHEVSSVIEGFHAKSDAAEEENFESAPDTHENSENSKEDL